MRVAGLQLTTASGSTPNNNHTLVRREDALAINLPEADRLRDIFSALGFVTTCTSTTGVL